MSDPLLPSAEVVFIAWATVHPDLAPLHGGRVGTKLAGTLPCVRVQRLGRPQTQRWEDAPELQVETWADPNEQGDADMLARRIVAALPDIVGPHAAHAAYVSSFVVTRGPAYVPDEQTDRARYFVDIELRVHPTGG